VSKPIRVVAVTDEDYRDVWISCSGVVAERERRILIIQIRRVMIIGGEDIGCGGGRYISLWADLVKSELKALTSNTDDPWCL
jgi:hypothetical protein